MLVLASLKDLLNPETIITYGGLTLLLATIFAENGLAIGFFLPGDSLVFISGLICATQPELLDIHVAWLIFAMIAAAIAGSTAGYYFGYKIGPPIFNRENSVLFNKKYIELTQNFYAKHGGKTLILGRFLPIIRTFAPILAGVIRVDFKNFLFFNVVGACLWVTPLVLAGYFLGNTVPQIKEYLGYIIGLFIISTTIILTRTYIKEKRKLNKS
ncbi:MAG TPA: VTT domain-containing protein [Luteibaculaceae bacterium]|nr:VTT domain-containing protein [Luteibaculaceae bacterium]